MCGIVGLIARNTYNGFSGAQQKMLYQLLYADAVRGEDATGVIGVMSDGDFGVMKEASQSCWFIEGFKGSDLDKALYSRGVAAIGHNRAKTVGKSSDENAHPFIEDETFAMVHNGTLRNHAKTFSDTEVDSHALTIALKQAMDEEDWKKALEDTLTKVQGAYACVWYDQKRHQMCLVRNSERPLCIAETANTTLFGSEDRLLTWIASRNGETVKSVKAVPIHTLVTFDLSKKERGEYSETFLSVSLSTKPTKGYSNGTTTTTANVGEDDNSSGEKGGVSKNVFKSLTRKMLGKRLTFWVEDFVDYNDNALIWGASTNGQYDLCEYNHLIKANIKLKALGLVESDLLGAVSFSGTVINTTYDKDSKAITVSVNNVEIEHEKIVH